MSDLSLSAQAQLPRAIQDLAVERVGAHASHRVEIRIVAATNRSLALLVEEGLRHTLAWCGAESAAGGRPLSY